MIERKALFVSKDMPLFGWILLSDKVIEKQESSFLNIILENIVSSVRKLLSPKNRIFEDLANFLPNKIIMTVSA